MDAELITKLFQGAAAVLSVAKVVFELYTKNEEAKKNAAKLLADHLSFAQVAEVGADAVEIAGTAAAQSLPPALVDDLASEAQALQAETDPKKASEIATDLSNRVMKALVENESFIEALRHFHFKIGDLIHERYEVLGLLGAGATGQVYRVKDQVLDLTLALKLFEMNQATGPAVAKHFQEQGKLLAAINHPGVVRVFDVINVSVKKGSGTQVVPGVVMEEVKGTNLDALMSGGKLPWATVKGLTQDLLSTVGFVHARGVIHRDITPKNVFFVSTPERRVKLIDFGFAKRTSDSGKNLSMRFGVEGYASPEYLQGKPVGTACDIYSVGALAYALLTGAPPLGHFKKPSEQGISLPAEAEQAILRALAQDPNDRFPSAQEFLEALDEGEAPSKLGDADEYMRASREDRRYGAVVLKAKMVSSDTLKQFFQGQRKAFASGDEIPRLSPWLIEHGHVDEKGDAIVRKALEEVRAAARKKAEPAASFQSCVKCFLPQTGSTQRLSLFLGHVRDDHDLDRAAFAKLLGIAKGTLDVQCSKGLSKGIRDLIKAQLQK